MPIGVPRIIYCWGEELPAQWTDIYNFIFRRRMVFLMQYLDDELCNQICGLLINIHMEDRSKELEKKEMGSKQTFGRSGKLNSSSSSPSGKGKDTKQSSDPKQSFKALSAVNDSSSSTTYDAFYNKKQRSMEDLLNADEDLGIEEIDTLEQYTLQKITTEWLNWNAQFFDYSDEPYLFYLAELLSKDLNLNEGARMGVNLNLSELHATKQHVTQLLQMLKNNKSLPFGLSGTESHPSEVYSPFRTHANFASGDYSLKDLNKGYKFKLKLLQMFNEYLISGAGRHLYKKNNVTSSFNCGFPKVQRTYQKTPKGFFGGTQSSSMSLGTIENKIYKFLSELSQKDFSLTSSSGTFGVQQSFEKKFTLPFQNPSDVPKPKGRSFQSILERKEKESKGTNLKALSQRNLRRNYSLESHFNSSQHLPLVGNNFHFGMKSNKRSFSYLDAGMSENSYSEFRSYYRKQTERALIEEESKKVFVIINSFGGSVGNGVTVHDALQFIKAGSLTLGLGVAASAASLVLAGGTIGERYVTEGCHTMLHQPESSIQGQASDIWIDSQEIMKIRLDVAEIYSLSTYRPRHKILRDLDRDFYLTASETIHYGLADEIATNEVMHSIIEMTSKVWDYHDTKQQRLLETRESASSGLDTQTQN
nr:proteolytic subunit 2 of clp protease [Chlorogonium euchlorum]